MINDGEIVGPPGHLQVVQRGAAVLPLALPHGPNHEREAVATQRLCRQAAVTGYVMLYQNLTASSIVKSHCCMLSRLPCLTDPIMSVRQLPTSASVKEGSDSH